MEKSDDDSGEGGGSGNGSGQGDRQAAGARAGAGFLAAAGAADGGIWERGRGARATRIHATRIHATRARATGAGLARSGLAEVQAAAARTESGDQVMQIPLDQIDRNPYQTRYFMKAEFESEDLVATTLHELAESIRANGVIQPIAVRPGAEGRYILILGERRCRASKIAGKTTIPAIVRKVSDQQAAEMTVVENLQRQDLNCMEQATAFSKLSQDFKLTQEQIGQRVGIVAGVGFELHAAAAAAGHSEAISA